MTRLGLRPHLATGLLLVPVILAGCVSQSSYDALQGQNERLQQQLASQSSELATSKQQISRLQGAIAYTVNSDLLFRPGSWEMNDRGKQIIADMSRKLAPTQQNGLMVSGYTDNTQVGPALRQRGITSNQDLSQKRAEAVMQFLISQGVSRDMVSARGFGETNPVAPNDTMRGRAQNRRVVLSLASA